VVAVPLYFLRREQDASRALREARLQGLTAQRQEIEGRLRSLRAQIEPHFLFNTLAHIQRLHEVDPGRGAAMLRSVVDYLGAALPQMRDPAATLERELALTRAYLNVQQIRMGDRLRVEIDVPQALLGAHVPAMMVLTLAENAIKHGVGPKRGGGVLRIAARTAGSRLECAVIDDGIGLRIGAGTGRGLSNTRARLAAQFGRHATLEIGNNEGDGVRAALLLPLRAP
jgi:LytS/YehU family sensor histidine kinase